MTDKKMALFERVEPQADSDLVPEMLACAVDRIQEAEDEARMGAAKGTRSPLRAEHSGWWVNLRSKGLRRQTKMYRACPPCQPTRPAIGMNCTWAGMLTG